MLLILTLFAPALYAQNLEVTPFAGISYGGSVPVEFHPADPMRPDLPSPDWIALKRGAIFGVAAGYRFSRYFDGEVLWSHRSTAAYAQGVTERTKVASAAQG
jgi:hypothetical protein